MKKLFIVICILFVVWVLVSFIDVNLHNKVAETVSDISDWNFFKILFG